jgi:membrane-associated phospholipid phosphatase
LKYTCFIILFIFIGRWGNAQNPDINLLRHINTERNVAFDPVFRSISNTEPYLGIIIPAGLIGSGFLSHDSLLTRKSLVIGCSMILASGISTVLKYSVNRERPFDRYSFIDKQAAGGSPSFPSGHTSSAFALATSLSLNFPKWYIAVPAFTWASSVGYSRMHLGVHYPSDVLIGAMIGSGSAWLSWKLNKKLFQ